jgi:calcineurin-like phosphoesterase family protein
MGAGKNFFTADWHLGDQRQDILGRPFATAEEMYERILTEYNTIVSPADTVYMLGDALHSSGTASPELLSNFNGHLILVRGNHDVLPDSAYAPYVEQVIAEGDGIELEIDGLDCWLTHYPTQSRADRFNLVGHIHAVWKCQRNMLNVGIDAHHFRPISAEQIRFYYNAICDFYDQDVWVGQHPANTAHADRGKPGRYLDQRRRDLK